MKLFPRKREPKPVFKTDLQDDLSPIEQAALAKLRMLKGENPVQHYEEPPAIRKHFFNRLFSK